MKMFYSSGLYFLLPGKLQLTLLIMVADLWITIRGFSCVSA